MQTSKIQILFCCFFIIAINAELFALTIDPPYSYKKTSSNLRYVLVMISPASDENLARWSTGELGKKKLEACREIRKKYKFSGLYKNDGSTTPLWTIDWYLGAVDISSDGKHLVRYGDKLFFSSYNDTAVVFYRNGEEIKRYKVKDLTIEIEDLSKKIRPLILLSWLEEKYFDEKNNTLVLKTKNGKKWIFDITTGGAKSTP